jgi:hypothetical protein
MISSPTRICVVSIEEVTCAEVTEPTRNKDKPKMFFITL